jgi:hypothetical protein
MIAFATQRPSVRRSNDIAGVGVGVKGPGAECSAGSPTLTHDNNVVAVAITGDTSTGVPASIAADRSQPAKSAVTAGREDALSRRRGRRPSSVRGARR